MAEARGTSSAPSLAGVADSRTSASSMRRRLYRRVQAICEPLGANRRERAATCAADDRCRGEPQATAVQPTRVSAVAVAEVTDARCGQLHSRRPSRRLQHSQIGTAAGSSGRVAKDQASLTSATRRR